MNQVLRQPWAVYVHVPFCLRRCGYCDFATSALPRGSQAAEQTMDDYVQAVVAELRSAEARPASTVYFGGGTPSHLGAARLTAILTALAGHGGIVDGAEVTVEANPTSVESADLPALRASGFNRVSIGLQSLRDDLLAVLDRTHDAAEGLAAVAAAREAGFDNLSVDLMFNLPYQRFDDWCVDLGRILQLRPEHISLYGLTIEPNTPLAAQVEAGLLKVPDEEVDAAMYEAAIERGVAAGYEHYEISNFSLPGRASQHNLTYWRNLEYRGFGPGAASYVNRRRWTNDANLQRWGRAVSQGGEAVAEEEIRDEDGERRETMFLGLRTRDGVDVAGYTARYGSPPEHWFAEELGRLLEAGWIERTATAWRLTSDGILVANRVFLEFV